MAHGLGVIHRLTGRAPPAAGPWGDEPQPAPDVCILDNYLPEISGVAILSLAMRTRGAMDVPVVVYSSDAAVEAAVAAVGHPRAYFALKTGRVRELVDRVETLVAM